MGRIADEFERETQALQDRIQKRINQLKEGGKITPQADLKPLDADIEHLLETLALDVKAYAEFGIDDDESGASDARRMETTARRLAREAGYALPETTRGD